MIALTISLFFRRESFSFIVTRLHRHKTMPKPKVWVHATQEEIFNNGWRTEFREMATQHFDIITAQELEKNSSLGRDVAGVLLIDLPRLLKQMPHMPNLKVVANHGVGYNHIDVKAFAEKGIKVSNTPDVLSDGVADMGMGLLLAGARNIYQEMIRSFNRPPLLHCIKRLSQSQFRRMCSESSKPLIWIHSADPDIVTGNDFGGYPSDQVEIMREYFEPIGYKDIEGNEASFAEKIVGAIICVPHSPKFYQQLSLMPNLKAVCAFAKGTDFVDVKRLTGLGIKVAKEVGYSDASVAEYGFSMLITSARNIVSGVKKAMGPDPPSFRLNDLGVEIHRKTLGIVGMGSIGLRLAKRAKAFDMQILYHNRNRREAEEKEVSATYYSKLHDMLPHCDFIIIICPLTPETEKLFGEKEFSLMKDSATIINIARGPIIDQDALVIALRGKQIRAAALDVTYPEPLPRDHPLLTLDNVIITPHYGSATVETRRKMCQCMVDNLKAVLIDGKDRMPNQVN